MEQYSRLSQGESGPRRHPGHRPPYNHMISSTTMYIGSHFSSVYIRTSPGYGDVKESSIWLLAVSGQAVLSLSKARVASFKTDGGGAEANLLIQILYI